jgi:hypothetical protein
MNTVFANTATTIASRSAWRIATSLMQALASAAKRRWFFSNSTAKPRVT